MAQMSPKAYVPMYAKQWGTSTVNALQPKLACARLCVFTKSPNIILPFSCTLRAPKLGRPTSHSPTKNGNASMNPL